jgi:NADH/NAD ratio-sensing transcriptional regulator Rex
MTHDNKALGKLASQLAEALDDLALAVENYRINERRDTKVIQAFNISQAAISKAQRESSR